MENRETGYVRTMVMSGSCGPRVLRAPRALRVLLLAAAASLTLLVSGVPTAAAHDELVGTTPAEGASVDAAPDAVELEMGSPPQALGTRVVVTGPDGAAAAEGDVEIRDTTVVQPLSSDLPPGAYTVDWQVTSADGHPLTGSFSFTLAAPADPTASAASTAAAAPAGGQDAAAPGEEPALAGAAADRSSSTAWIGGGAALVLAGAIAVAVRQIRRRA